MAFSTFLLVAVLCIDIQAAYSAECSDTQVKFCTEQIGFLDFSNTKALCQSLKKVASCLDSLKESCELNGDKLHLVNQASAQVENMGGSCEGSESKISENCKMSDVEECMEPLEDVYRKGEDSDYSKMCPTLQKAAVCLLEFTSYCDNAADRMLVEDKVKDMQKLGIKRECSKKGYKIKGSDGNSGGYLQPSLLAVLVTLGVGIYHRGI